MNKIWPFSFYLFFFAAVAFFAPFLVLYYQNLGFTGTQIGIVTGLTPLVTLVSAPLWTRLADRTQRHKSILSLLLMVGSVSLYAFSLFNTFGAILLVAIIFSIIFAPLTALSDSATMQMLGPEKEMYGRVRVGGTIGFGLAAAFAGALIQNFSLKIAFWGSSFFIVLAWLVAQKLSFKKVAQSKVESENVRELLAARRWRYFLILAFAGGMGGAITNNYLLPHMSTLGASESIMGLALTLGTVSEFPILFFGDRLLKFLKAYGLLILALFITGFRMILFAAAASPQMILWAQILHGLTFAAMWMAGVAYADENAPASLHATAQGLFGAMVFGIGSAVGGFLGGPLLETIGSAGLFYIFGGATMAIVFVIWILEKIRQTTPKPQSPQQDG